MAELYRLKKDSINIPKGTLFIEEAYDFVDYLPDSGEKGSERLAREVVEGSTHWFEPVELVVQLKEKAKKPSKQNTKRVPKSKRVAMARELRRQGYTLREIGNTLGWSRATISVDLKGMKRQYAKK